MCYPSYKQGYKPSYEYLLSPMGCSPYGGCLLPILISNMVRRISILTYRIYRPFGFQSPRPLPIAFSHQGFGVRLFKDTGLLGILAISRLDGWLWCADCQHSEILGVDEQLTRSGLRELSLKQSYGWLSK